MKKKKKNEAEEASINKGEENTGCDSCHLPLGWLKMYKRNGTEKKKKRQDQNKRQ